MRLTYTPPPGWDFTSVEDLAKPEKGSIRIGPFGSALKKHEYSEGGIRVLGIEDVQPNQFVSDRCKYIPKAKFRELTQYEVSDGDVLVTNMGTVGRACFVPSGTEKSIISSHLIKISLDPSKADPNYLCWMLNFSPLVVAQIKAKIHGAIMAGFNSSLLKSLQIPLPPLPEQKRIAKILDAADALRSKRRESLVQLDTLLQSTFLDMFGDPVTNPRGWEIASGASVSQRLTVGIVVKPASYYQESGVPALRSLNVRPNKIETEALVYISPEDNESRLKKTRVWKGDVLLVRSGQPGTAAIVPSELDGANAIDILILTPRQETIHPVYLCNYFNSAGGKRMALGAQRGQIQKHLNVGSLKLAPIPLPPLDLQHRFAAIVESVEQQKASQRAHLAELDNLFASLQSRAFRGDL